MRRTIVALATAALVATLGVEAACGRDVDIGGAPTDASPDGEDASITVTEDGESPPLAECDPCLASVECGEFATCAPVGGTDGFCLALCGDAGNVCDNDDRCATTKTVAGTNAVACVPIADACAPAPPPTQGDGAVLDQCGLLIGPQIEGSCRSCEKTSPTCQKNGCYGGWWCNTNTRKCQKPPTACP